MGGRNEPQPQVFPKSNTVSRYFSTEEGSVPMSPHVTRYSGFSAISATDSAVRVYSGDQEVSVRQDKELRSAIANILTFPVPGPLLFC